MVTDVAEQENKQKEDGKEITVENDEKKWSACFSGYSYSFLSLSLRAMLRKPHLSYAMHNIQACT